MAVWPSGRAGAQVSVHATVGARYTTALVHDVIVVPVDVKPAIGPAGTLSIGERTNGPWTPEAALDVSWASLLRHESGEATKFNSVTVIAFTVGARREVSPGLAARVGIGGIKYLPAEETGMFRGGSGLWAVGTAGLYWTPTGLGGPAHDFGVSLRYDVHRFSTSALHADGFTSAQLVHRVSLGIGARILGKGRSTP
jgi:hypothetical protein